MYPQGAYRAYCSNAKFMNAASAPGLAFMAAAVIELHGLDGGAAYAHAFGAVRALALTLRGALTGKTKDAYREVYCWQVSRQGGCRGSERRGYCRGVLALLSASCYCSLTGGAKASSLDLRAE